MKTLKVNIPDTVDFDDKDALMAIAARLFEKGKLSLGQAADVVGMTKSSFMDALGDYGVSFFNYSVSDVERDVENGQDYSL